MTTLLGFISHKNLKYITLWNKDKNVGMELKQKQTILMNKRDVRDV